MISIVKQLQLEHCISKSFRFGHLNQTSGGSQIHIVRSSSDSQRSHLFISAAKIAIIYEFYVRSSEYFSFISLILSIISNFIFSGDKNNNSFP